jgi:hypothetical protein
MKIRTIKDLKRTIQDLPDDEVMCNGGNGSLWSISHWIVSKDTLTEEELRIVIQMV